MHKFRTMGASAFAWGAAAGVSVMLAACQTTPVGGEAVIAIIGKEANDFVASGGSQLPPALPTVEYRNEDNFDLRLYSALQELPQITVTLEDVDNGIPERAEYWLSRIATSEGKISTCAERTGTGFAEAVAIWILDGIKDEAARRVKSWALYRPAEKMNAVILIDPETEKPTRLRFVSRDIPFEEHKLENYGPCPD